MAPEQVQGKEADAPHGPLGPGNHDSLRDAHGRPSVRGDDLRRAWFGPSWRGTRRPLKETAAPDAPICWNGSSGAASPRTPTTAGTRPTTWRTSCAGNRGGRRPIRRRRWTRTRPAPLEVEAVPTVVRWVSSVLVIGARRAPRRSSEPDPTPRPLWCASLLGDSPSGRR